MENGGANSSWASRIHHIGIVVRDIEKAIEYYESLGIGPFEPLSLKLTDREVHGKPADNIRNISMMAQMGPIRFELVQPVSGESVQKEFLETRGEGGNHLGFAVDNLEEEVAKLMEKGCTVISSGKFAEGGGFAYLDTDKVGGVIFDFLELP